MRIRTFFLALLGVCMVISYNVKAADDEIDADADPLNPGKKPPRLFVGPVAGYNRSLHSGGFSSIAKTANCPDFNNGTDNGYYFGLTVEFLLGNVKNSKSSIIARVLYDYQPAFFTVPGDKYPSKLADGTEINTEIEHTTNVKYTLLNLEVMYKLNIPGTFLWITAGPQFGIPIGGTQEQRYSLVFDPLHPVQFPVNLNDTSLNLPKVNGYAPKFYDASQTSIILYEGDIIERNSFRAGIKFGLQYEILLGRAVLVPSAYYNLGLTKINARDNWRVNALQFGADLRFAL